MAEDAHAGMYANPADFRVIHETWGEWHEDVMTNSMKSLHATMAGQISGTRYDWNAQNTRNAVYATYAIEVKDGDIPVEKGHCRLSSRSRFMIPQNR